MATKKIIHNRKGYIHIHAGRKAMQVEQEKIKVKFIDKLTQVGLCETTANKVYKITREQLHYSYQRGYSVGRKNGN